jgi:hypothetical protein
LKDAFAHWFNRVVPAGDEASTTVSVLGFLVMHKEKDFYPSEN